MGGFHRRVRFIVIWYALVCSHTLLCVEVNPANVSGVVSVIGCVGCLGWAVSICVLGGYGRMGGVV